MGAQSFDQQSFARRLDRALDRSEHTRREIADALRVSPNRVSEWAHARTLPSVPQLARLAAIVDCDPTWLLTGRVGPAAREELVRDLVAIAPKLEDLGSRAALLKRTRGRA